jgi:hypothetical protein
MDYVYDLIQVLYFGQLDSTTPELHLSKCHTPILKCTKTLPQSNVVRAHTVDLNELEYVNFLNNFERPNFLQYLVHLSLVDI